MLCSHCGKENPDIATFCMFCASSLESGNKDLKNDVAEKETNGNEKKENNGPNATDKENGQHTNTSLGEPAISAERVYIGEDSEEVPPYPVHAPVGIDAENIGTQDIRIVQEKQQAQPSQTACPSCYARNPAANRFCNDCGTKLIVHSAPIPAVVPRATGSPIHDGSTEFMQPVSMTEEQQPDGREYSKKDRGRLLGPSFSDFIALAGMTGLIIVVLSFFGWYGNENAKIGSFEHLGAWNSISPTSPIVGQPGLLPYSGWEWVTAGMLASLAIALVMVFIIVRFARGIVFIFAGCIAAIIPFTYLMQAILPLKESGYSLLDSVGVSTLFNVELGTPIWIIIGSSAMLILAGLLTPPRRLGRLAAAVLLTLLSIGVSLFLAIAYNFNLFI